jgi:hypothetical protein
MGALIVTKGTRRLVYHFNSLFSSFANFAAGAPYENVVKDLGPNSTIIPSPAYPFLYQLSEAYRGKRAGPGGGDVFYPDTHAHHQNLLARWKHFLRKELDPNWHTAIRDALYNALTAGDYNKVVFDTVIADAQYVMVADEYDLSASGDNRAGTKYMKIVLVTPATQAPDPIDDQKPV